MKLLFDQNISYRIVKRITSIYPDSEQVRRLGLENKTDREIWDFAREEQFSIVTFDSDFYDMSLLLGHPPKVIWLKIGNTTTENIESILNQKSSQIKAFIEDSDLRCLEIIE